MKQAVYHQRSLMIWNSSLTLTQDRLLLSYSKLVTKLPLHRSYQSKRSTAPPHSLRVWVRSPMPNSLGSSSSIYEPSIHSSTSSYAYQRIWKTDALKIGSRLDFASLGSKVIMGLPRSGGPETVFSDDSPITPVSAFSHGRTPGGSLDSGTPSYYRHAYH